MASAYKSYMATEIPALMECLRAKPSKKTRLFLTAELERRISICSQVAKNNIHDYQENAPVYEKDLQELINWKQEIENLSP